MPGPGWRMMLAMKSVWTLILLCPLGALAQSAAAPSVDQIVDHYVQAAGGKDAIEKVTSRDMKGTLENSDDGTTSPAEVFAKAPDKYISVIDIGEGGPMLECWGGGEGGATDADRRG